MRAKQPPSLLGEFEKLHALVEVGLVCILVLRDGREAVFLL